MNVAIVGFATEGRASYDYFIRHGHTVTICDINTVVEVPTLATVQLGNHYLDNLDRFDLIVRSAGIHPSVILQPNPTIDSKITTAINEFLRACPTKNVIGVTGTKGKGTTSTLIAEILRATNHTTYFGGNIGRSPLEFIDDLTPNDWVVLELSSFQLCDLTRSPHLALCLMVVPEHLNWHADMAEYIAAKSQLFMHQERDDVAIYYADNALSKEIASHGEGQKIPYFTPPGACIKNDDVIIDGRKICRTNELQLLGAHNWQNICAAVTAVWQAGIRDIQSIRSVLTTFTGLEHRLEFVREHDLVSYYDDSFGTTPETALVAIEAFAQPKVIILGGSDKGASYDTLAATIAHHNVRAVVLIGKQADRLQKALETAGFATFTPGGNTMREIVAAATNLAKPGDVVLLSTACASFDMFENYKDRGNQFKQAVQSLA